MVTMVSVEQEEEREKDPLSSIHLAAHVEFPTYYEFISNECFIYIAIKYHYPRVLYGS